MAANTDEVLLAGWQLTCCVAGSGQTMNPYWSVAWGLGSPCLSRWTRQCKSVDAELQAKHGEGLSSWRGEMLLVDIVGTRWGKGRGREAAF